MLQCIGVDTQYSFLFDLSCNRIAMQVIQYITLNENKVCGNVVRKSNQLKGALRRTCKLLLYLKCQHKLDWRVKQSKVQHLL
jgi:hypothetical protein